MLVQLFADFFGSLVGELRAKKQARKRSSLASMDYGLGKPVYLSASVFGLSKRISGWIGGVLEVDPGIAYWHAGFYRENKGYPVSAQSFGAERIRQVTSGESVFVNTECLVLVGEIDGRRIEIALLVDDMAVVLDALGVSRLLD